MKQQLQLSGPMTPAKRLTPIELRLWAEHRLAKEQRPSEDGEGHVSRILHELHVHDAEIEIQNEELQRVRGELEEGITRYRELFDLSPIGYLEIGGNGHIQGANWAVCSMLGVSHEELFGRELSSLVVPEDAQTVHQHWQYVSHTRSRHSCDVFAISSSGERLALRMSSGAPASDAPGATFFMALIDITDHKRAEEMARDQEAQIRAFVDASHDAILSTDRSGTILSINPAAERTFGFATVEALGLQVAMLVPSCAFESLLDEAGRPAATPSRRVGVGRRKDGSSFPLELDVGKVAGGSCGSRRVMIIVRDRSEDTRAEAAFHRAERMEAIGKMAAGIVHDFNNVLGGIQCFAEGALRRSTASDATRSDLLEIKQAVGTGVSIVRQLATLTSLDGTEPAEIPVDATIQRVAPLLGRLLGEHVEVSLNFCRSGASIYAIPGHLEQILINLTLNARDAMQGVGTFRIETEERVIEGDKQVTRGYVVLSLADTGSGMDEKTRARLFEPYFTTKGTQGTGLGLMAVASTVKRLGGWIEVSSQPAQGTTFTLYLPRSSASMPAEDESSAGPVSRALVERRLSGIMPKAKQVTTILVVDDDPPTRSVLQRMLQDSQYSVHIAAGVSEAMRISENEQIHVLLTDLFVRDGRGDTLAEVLRARDPELAVLFVSGWPLADDDMARRSLSHPRTKFLSKPVEFDLLLTVLAELVQEHTAVSNDSSS